MLVADDLGAGYEQDSIYRLEGGRGWTEEATRLSGYRAAYLGRDVAFTEVTCQVECYLSVQNAQAAYRAYIRRIGEQIKSSDQYDVINEREEQSLGEWGWAFEMRSQDTDTVHYIYVRENVLVESVLVGTHSPDFVQQAVRMAQVVDRRISSR